MDTHAEHIADLLEERLFVEVEASGRHVHLSKEDALALFGHELTPKSELSQPGQFACHERVTLTGPKGSIARVAILGPCRGETQAEVSLTDAVALGIDVPVRLSGHLEGTPSITIEGPKGKAEGRVIVAKRHVHLRPEDARHMGVENGQTIGIRTLTDRPVVFEGVVVRVSPSFMPRVHLDYDEANACHHKKGDLGMILHG